MREAGCNKTLASSCPLTIANNGRCDDILQCANAMLEGDPNNLVPPCKLKGIVNQTVLALKPMLEFRFPGNDGPRNKALLCLRAIAGQCCLGCPGV